MAKAQGQFTIVDFNDAITLTGYIGTNLAKTQMFNPDNDSYTPDWSETNMVLTPSLFVAGTSTDKITAAEVIAVKWFEGNSTSNITTAGNYALSGVKSHILTIKGNVMAGLPGKDFRCEVSYKDGTTGLTLNYSMSISFTRVVNGSGITDLIVTTPDGNVFKNDAITELRAIAALWRGSSKDSTNVSYQWYKMDASVTTDEGGGVGWKKLTNAAGSYSGVNTEELTVNAAAVSSYATFKCIAKDTDASSASYNQNFTDTASFVDVSDPLSVVITSTGGDVFKNGQGSTVLTAKVYRGGEEIDSAGSGSYVWTKYGADGTVDTSWGTSGQKSGKTLSVGGADVSVKATFMVEVTL